MGILSFWNRKEKNKTTEKVVLAPTMNGALPFYTSFGDSIYASDIVVQAIRCKANEIKKLNPRHIRFVDGQATLVTDSTIARALRRPTEYMTTADFLEKITILLELNKNVYIYPMYYVTQANERFYTGLYPLKPSQVTYLTDAQGKMYINLQFANGYQTTLPKSSIIHWRKDYGVNDYFGGNALGSNDDAGLLTMLRRYDELTQSIAKALQVSCAINGIVKYSTYDDDGTLDARLKDFETRLKNNESGILATDLSLEYTPMERDIKLVDKETLDFFYQTILRSTGVSLAVFNGDYTKAQKEAFYEHAIEADIKSLGQAFTNTVFTEREISFGNEIEFYPNEINFMSMEDKIAFAQIAMPSGSLMKDEFRRLFGYAPMPDGMGQVVAQGYNALLDENNNNTLDSTNNGGAENVEQTE